MKINLKTIILIFIAILISNSIFAGTDDNFVPTWKVGQRWVLEASYRDLRTDGDSWMPPIQWIFHVRAKKIFEGQECYVLHIYGRRSSQKNQAILWLAVKDLKPIKVIDVFPTASGMKYQERSVNSVSSEPLVADDTPIPYDMPAFPLENIDNRAQSADVFSGYNRAVSVDAKKFSKIKNIGGISFKRNLSQKTRKPDKQYADIFNGYSNNTRNIVDSYQIEINEDRTSNKLIQLWQKGSPWAISSASRVRRVRLVPESEYLPHNGGIK